MISNSHMESYDFNDFIYSQKKFFDFLDSHMELYDFMIFVILAWNSKKSKVVLILVWNSKIFIFFYNYHVEFYDFHDFRDSHMEL